MKGYTAFRAAYLGTDQINLKNFADFHARQLRYSILWAMYENTAYDMLDAETLHSWSQLYKQTYGLYDYIRGIYNPTYRLCEFWKAHLWGGVLDRNAGDGKEKESALPIVTGNEKMREAIAQVWAWSNWQTQKDVYSLWGTTFGDGIIKVVDNPNLKKVYLSIIHPSKLADVVTDEWGNVKGYALEYERKDPRDDSGNMALYRELAYRDGKNVVYETYLEESPFGWDDRPEKWEEPLGFVPMVFMKHNDVGLQYGWSEIHAGLSKFREVDDQASKLNDQIRKIVEGGGIMAGVKKPEESDIEKSSGNAGREEAPMFWTTNTDAKYIPLVAPLDIAAVLENIRDLLKELERDYPELNYDMTNVSGDISGRALRLNRAPIENKVKQRRPNYDNALVRAQMMAISIGGMRGYDKFKGFTLDSFAKGDLEHTIDERPVFAKDPLDEIEVNSSFWEAANKAKAAGVPLSVYLELSGWAADKIKKITSSEEYKLRMESSRLAVAGARAAVEANPIQAQNKTQK